MSSGDAIQVVTFNGFNQSERASILLELFDRALVLFVFGGRDTQWIVCGDRELSVPFEAEQRGVVHLDGGSAHPRDTSQIAKPDWTGEGDRCVVQCPAGGEFFEEGLLFLDDIRRRDELRVEVTTVKAETPCA